MRGQRYWIKNGKFILEDIQELVDDALWQSMAQRGEVRLVTGPKGTEVKWVIDAPNYLNLSFLCQCLADHAGPYILRYFSAGWFEESFETADRAVWRIEDLMLHADRCLGRRTFIKLCEPKAEEMPPILRETWATGVPIDNTVIECKFQPEVKQFVVEKIGSRTPIGRIWGTGPYSGPCVPTGSFDATVSKSYEQVLQNGEVRYDQVIASFLFPDNAVRWVPYHRLIIPNSSTKSPHQSVFVIAEIAAVSFNVI
jgi:hypothetical protein